MAGEAGMAVADGVANVLAGEHGDFVREAVAISLDRRSIVTARGDPSGAGVSDSGRSGW